MCFLKSLFAYYSFFVVFSFSTKLEIVEEDELRKMLQETMPCFMVNTAAKIHRINVENKMYDKNIIFSPMDLYATTLLIYLGSTDDHRVQRQLGSFLGIKTVEKFLELNPEYEAVLQTQDITMKSPKNLVNLNNELPSNENDYHNKYQHLVHTELGNMFRDSMRTKKAAVRSGEAIFVDVKYAVKNTFIEKAKRYYNVDVKCTDFEKNAEKSTNNINAFIKNQTYDRISDFFDEPLDKTTKSVLSSSFTLVTSWKKMFQPKDSYETAFHIRDGECDDCDDVDICVMMNQGKIPYYADSTVSAIALPTTDSRIRIYYVVPRGNHSLSEIVTRPNRNFVTRIINGMKSEPIVYSVPKMSFRGEVDQLEILRTSGLSKIKLQDIADHLTLSIFKHTIFFEVNEEGIGGCPLRKSKKMPVIHKSIDTRAVEFVADRPFLFFIYNNETRMFLFYGAVFKPTGYFDY